MNVEERIDIFMKEDERRREIGKIGEIKEEKLSERKREKLRKNRRMSFF